MKKPTDFNAFQPATTPIDPITEVLREGAKKMLQAAINEEVEDYLSQFTDRRDAEGKRLVVRNGLAPKRSIQTGLGSIEVQRPRINDRRLDDDGNRIQFTSKILPPYLRRTKSVEDLIPWLYLEGVSTGDFSEALGCLLGENAPGLSSTTIVRLKQVWEDDFKDWNRRDLSNKRYAYIRVDGIHFNIRLEEQRQCILVVMGATADGKKELLAVEDGVRESEQSWKEVLLDLKARGLQIDPELAIGDGALGFWKALPQVWPKTRIQRCWVHKTANVLNKLPRSSQPKAMDALHQIWMAESKANATKAFDLFIEIYAAKYPKASSCLAQRQGRAARVLRLPRTALDAHPNDESHRVYVCHGASPHAANEGLRVTDRVPHDGLQTRSSRRAQVAEAKRTPAARRRHPRSSTHGRHQGRRVISLRSHPQLLTISQSQARVALMGLPRAGAVLRGSPRIQL
jgi:putative transposase